MSLGKVGSNPTQSVIFDDFDFLLVNIWDVVGEDQVLKGEYKVISGRMYASELLIWIPVLRC